MIINHTIFVQLYTGSQNYQSNYEKALPEHLSEQANEALKSGYNLDFLGVTKPIKERELENLLVSRIKDFLSQNIEEPCCN